MKTRAYYPLNEKCNGTSSRSSVAKDLELKAESLLLVDGFDRSKDNSVAVAAETPLESSRVGGRVPVVEIGSFVSKQNFKSQLMSEANLMTVTISVFAGPLNSTAISSDWPMLAAEEPKTISR